MKYLSILALLVLSITGTAQNNLTVFSEDGMPFYLILNGIRQNENPQTNIRVEQLPQSYYTAKVMFNDGSTAAIDKKHLMVTGVDCEPCDVAYKIKYSKKGELVMKAYNFTPIAQAPAPPANVQVVQYNTVPMPAIQMGVQVTETTTTTTTTGAGTSDNVNVGVNVGGVNFGMHVSVNEPNVQSTQTTTVTTSTTTVGNGGGVITKPQTCQMGVSDFNSAKQSISSKDFSNSKLTVAKQIAGGNCLTAQQIKEITSLFTYEDDKLEFAKYAYSNCIDKNNYYKVNDAFEFESTIEELQQSIY